MKSKNLVLCLFYITINLFFILLYFFVDSNFSYYYSFTYCGFLIISSLLIFYLFFVKKIEVFDPMILVTLIYSLIFYITPMIDYYFKNPYYFGFNVIGGSTKGVIISLLGYISFFYLYVITSFKKDKIIKEINCVKSKVIFVNLILWSIGLLLSIFLLKGQGISLSYILSFGAFGDVLQSKEGSLNFLGMFSYSMIVPWLYLMINVKSKNIKLIITVVTLSVFYLRGFRFILLIMLLSPLIFYYTSRKRNPPINIIGLTSILTILMIGIIGFIRGDVRSGREAKWNEFNFESIWYGLESNFNIYKAFYRLIEIYDYQNYYTLGKQISYTFIIMIPKFLWSGKPDTPLREILEITLGSYAVSAGAAWPNIGEYFSEFGIIGVVLFMGLLGFLFKKMNYFYKNSYLTTHLLVIFSIGYPFIVQIIIRGYTPTNFWMGVFFLVPIYINYKVGETKNWSRRLNSEKK